MTLLWLGLIAAACVIAQEISGTAVDSVTGAPLGKVTIEVEGTSVTTDAAGHFKLADLPPGQYRLTAHRNGYLESTSHPITLNAGQSVKDIQIKLFQFGVIAGTVRDDDGDPLMGIMVGVSRLAYDDHGRRRISGYSSAETDDLGQYRIPGLKPGRYYVGIENNKASGPTRQTEVGPGERVTGIDITLTHPATVRVSGHAVVPAGTYLSSITLRSDRDGLSYVPGGRTEQNGDFEFAHVPAAVYTLIADASLPTKPSTNIFELFRQSGFKAQMPLVVGSEPLKDVRIAVDAGAEITGHINVPASGRRVAFDGGIDVQADTYVHDDQTFNLLLARGHYDIDRRILPGYIVHSIEFDGRDIQDEGSPDGYWRSFAAGPTEPLILMSC